MSGQDGKAATPLRRWRWLGAVLGVTLVGALAYGLYWAR